MSLPSGPAPRLIWQLQWKVVWAIAGNSTRNIMNAFSIAENTADCWMLTHVVRLSQVLHNGDIIADGYVRPLKPQAAKGAKSADGAAEPGADAVPAEAAAVEPAANKVSSHLKNFD